METGADVPGYSDGLAACVVVLYSGHLDAVSTVMEPSAHATSKYWTSAETFSKNCFHLKKQEPADSRTETLVLATQPIRGCGDEGILPNASHTDFARSNEALQQLVQSSESKLGMQGKLFPTNIALQSSNPRKRLNTFCLYAGSRRAGTIQFPKCASN